MVLNRSDGAVLLDAPAAAGNAEGAAGKRGIVAGEGIEAVGRAVAVEIDRGFHVESGEIEAVARNDIAPTRGNREIRSRLRRPRRRVRGLVDQRGLGRGQVGRHAELIGVVRDEVIGAGGYIQTVMVQPGCAVIVEGREIWRVRTDIPFLEAQVGVGPAVARRAGVQSVSAFMHFQARVLAHVRGKSDIAAAVVEIFAVYERE